MKPLTMTEEKEREYRACCTSGGTEVDPVFAELDALRVALAAAEAKLSDERRQLTAALEAERLHADALAGLFEPIASGRLVPWLPCKHAEDAMAMHAARRAAEKEEGR